MFVEVIHEPWDGSDREVTKFRSCRWITGRDDQRKPQGSARTGGLMLQHINKRQPDRRNGVAGGEGVSEGVR